MSLATRCTSCGTVFRVVQDQLKVSEGWVRCGRCNAVFNALDGLFDLGRELPPEWDQAARRDGERSLHEAPDGDEPSAQEPFPATAPLALDELLDPIDAHLFRNRRSDGNRKAADQLGPRDRPEFSDARFDSELFAENVLIVDPEHDDPPATDVGEIALESEGPQPDFLRRAERRARWHRTPVRLALGALAMLGAAALALQIANHYRDVLAAQWPQARPVLGEWCRIADCVIEAPRRIDDVSVESTALTRASGIDAFILSVTLRSRSHMALAMPSIDLSLTDANGHLVARRALGPQDFKVASVLQPGTEAALQLMLGAGNAHVSGYTVEIFYP